MAENSVDFISAIEAEQQGAFLRKLNGELDRNLTNGFETALIELVEYASRDIPPVPITNIVERTGPQGVLPPPERRAAAVAILSGEKPLEARVSVEKQYTGRAEKPIDLLEFHFITEINAGTLASLDESEDVATLLHWFDSVRNVRDWLVETNEGADARVKRFAGVMHLISRGVIGNTTYHEMSLNGDGAVSKAAEVFTGSYRGLVSGTALGQISDDFVSHQLLSRQVDAKIREPHQRGVLRIPVLITPKSYQSQTGNYYQPLLSSSPLLTEMPSILVTPGQDPQVGMMRKGAGFVGLKEVK